MTLLQKTINQCDSLSDVCKKFGYHINGYGFKKVKEMISANNLDISHFTKGSKKNRIYPVEIKTCPICDKPFKALIGHKKEKTTCSHACANTYFRSGSGHWNYKDGVAWSNKYRKICFKHHKKKCVVCGEKLIIEVHHYDENKKNNLPENLIPLCPTHHSYLHLGYKSKIINIIDEYIKNFNHGDSSLKQSP